MRELGLGTHVGSRQNQSGRHATRVGCVSGLPLGGPVSGPRDTRLEEDPGGAADRGLPRLLPPTLPYGASA
ncbi:MAG: hypothetical protein JWO67_4333 [Streptosporangiaceae bacterium]|nr:hypothetical protein [Streptosporangiaceae bacterium]